jgi:hypothetical protein
MYAARSALERKPPYLLSLDLPPNLVDEALLVLLVHGLFVVLRGGVVEEDGAVADGGRADLQAAAVAAALKSLRRRGLSPPLHGYSARKCRPGSAARRFHR